MGHARRWSRVFIFLAGVLMPSLAEADPIDERSAVHSALKLNSVLRASLLEYRAATTRLSGERARDTIVWITEGEYIYREAPVAVANDVVIPETSQAMLSTRLQKRFPIGTVVALSATGTRLYQRLNPTPLTADVISVGPSYGVEYALEINQPLLRGAGTDVGRAELDAAHLNQRRAVVEWQSVAGEVLANVLSAYWELWYAERALEAQVSARDLAQARYREGDLRVKDGTMPSADLLSLATSLASFEEKVLEAERTLDDRRLDLGTRIGAPQATEFTAASDAPPSNDAIFDESAMIAAALRASPELLVQRAELDRARQDVRLTDDARQPRLDLSAKLGSSGLGNDSLERTASTLREFPLTASIGLTFELPFDNTLREGQHAEAQLTYEAKAARLTDAEQQVATQVRSALRTLATARRRHELALTTLGIAKQAADAENSRMQLGTTRALDVAAVAVDVRDAELRVRRATVDAALARISLGRVTGGIVQQFVPLNARPDDSTVQ